jgi:hypothetical protein
MNSGWGDLGHHVQEGNSRGMVVAGANRGDGSILDDPLLCANPAQTLLDRDDLALDGRQLGSKRCHSRFRSDWSLNDYNVNRCESFQRPGNFCYAATTPWITEIPSLLHEF